MKSENADKIKNAFTIQSEHFETHKANFMKKEYLDYVISEVQPQKTDSVLEVAAGTCICGRSFALYVGQVKYFATRVMIKRIKQRKTPLKQH